MPDVGKVPGGTRSAVPSPTSECDVPVFSYCDLMGNVPPPPFFFFFQGCWLDFSPLFWLTWKMWVCLMISQTLHGYNLAWGLHCHAKSDDISFKVTGVSEIKTANCSFWILVLCSSDAVWLLHLKDYAQHDLCNWFVFSGDNWYVFHRSH